MTKVESGIAIPPRKGYTKEKYPWKQMEIGDSFFVPRKITTTGGMISAAAKRLGFRFTSRSVNDGTRIWRIA